MKTVISPEKLLRTSSQMTACGSSTKWEWDIAPGTHLVEGDAAQITQVFNNVLLNAVQSMPQGGTVRVHAGDTVLQPDNPQSLPPGQYVRISVSDEGSGIAPENLGKIFDPFFTTKETGTGLGLASVHSIVRQHHGHIAVASAVGKGTTFTIHLPASTATMPEETAERPVRPQRRKPARVLAMDDEEPIRQLLSEAIARLGHSIEVVSNGADAVERYRAGLDQGTRFDAVILDLTVPGGMGGRAVAKELLRLDRRARLIVSSGYSTDPVLSQFEAHGFCAAIPKPYRFEDVSRVLAQVLNKDNGHPAQQREPNATQR